MKSVKGFTMVELLVVISIISILAVIGTVVFQGITKGARDSKRVADLQQIGKTLQMFYYQHGRFPITGGAPSWDEHWVLFSACLESGTGCGFTPTNFTPVMYKVPQDPQDDPGTLSDSDPTYYTGWEGRTTENYLLRVRLENSNHFALSQDADGGWRTAVDGGCDDPYYCLKYNWPW